MIPQWLNWATLVSSAASLTTAVAALIAFIFLKRQQMQTERQITGTTSRYMYEEMSKLLGMLPTNPDLRPFIYEGRRLDSAITDDQRCRVLAIAGLALRTGVSYRFPGPDLNGPGKRTNLVRGP